MSDSIDQRKVPNAPSLPLYILYQTLGLLAFLVSLIPILLYRSVLHVYSPWRPHPTWSLRRDLAIALGRWYMHCSFYFSLPRPEGNKAWKEHSIVRKLVGKGTQVKVVTISPVSDDWITGIARLGNGYVKPEPVPGFWTFSPNLFVREGDERPMTGERVIMYVPGGSWVLGHPQGTPFPYRFCTTSGHRVLSINYRKAVTPSTAFPAQLLDATAGYAYLLSLGFEPANITLVGDSAGGHLILALSRYLAELDAAVSQLEVGVPGALLLLSPSCDISHPPHPRCSTDYLVPCLSQRAYASLSRYYDPSSLGSNPYFSPAACGSFAYLAKAQLHREFVIWIQYGDGENLKEDIEALIQKMRQEGVHVEADVVKGGVHLDAGIAFALLERGKTSSWNRLLDAIRNYA